ncbi:hypothetical protein TRVL_08121 [Trypanosoma vivax]|nr:hypothetical protein TRVL_08121 [Trypanosoma vivax]
MRTAGANEPPAERCGAESESQPFPVKGQNAIQQRRFASTLGAHELRYLKRRGKAEGKITQKAFLLECFPRALNKGNGDGDGNRRHRFPGAAQMQDCAPRRGPPLLIHSPSFLFLPTIVRGAGFI